MKVKRRKMQNPHKRGTVKAAQVRKAIKAVCKPDLVQIKNPKTGLYIKIDRAKGMIVSQKKTKGKYKNIPVARVRNEVGE